MAYHKQGRGKPSSLQIVLVSLKIHRNILIFLGGTITTNDVYS